MTACGQAIAADFGLNGIPTLSRSIVDRGEWLRNDAMRLVAGWGTARLLLVDPRGQVPLRDGHSGPALDFGSTTAFGQHPPASAVLLGERDGVCYWAMRDDREPSEAGRPGWQGLHAVGALLDDADAGLLTTAIALLSWHDNAGFCARCGVPTNPVQAGWARACPGCGHEEYPRTDPAVICLVHDGAEHVLLARQPIWPAERYSVLAGFVEAGESLESCVAREVAEEVGVTVHSIRYLGSQPWPFPRSLMLGFAAIADRTAPLRPADGEIEHAHWVPRDTVRAALAAGGAIPGLALPGEVSIAHRMLESWAGV